MKSLAQEMASMRKLLGIDDGYRTTFSPNYDVAITKIEEVRKTLNRRSYEPGNNEFYVSQKLAGVHSSIEQLGGISHPEDVKLTDQQAMEKLAHFMHLVETSEASRTQ